MKTKTRPRVNAVIIPKLTNKIYVLKIIQDDLINDAAKTKSVCTSEHEHKKHINKNKNKHYRWVVTDQGSGRCLHKKESGFFYSKSSLRTKVVSFRFISIVINQRLHKVF